MTENKRKQNGTASSGDEHASRIERPTAPVPEAPESTSGVAHPSSAGSPSQQLLPDMTTDSAKAQQSKFAGVLGQVEQSKRAATPGADGTSLKLMDDQQLQAALERIWTSKFVSGFDETGHLVFEQKFENDPEKLFGEGGNREVVCTHIAKLLGGRIDRRRIGEALLAAGVEEEQRQAGSSDQLPYSHRALIGKLPKRADRLEIASEVHKNNLSVDALRERLNGLIEKKQTEEVTRGQVVLRELEKASNLLTSNDIREFLNDEEKLQKISRGQRAKLLEKVANARENTELLIELLTDFEDKLWEIATVDRQKKRSESGQSENEASED